MPLHRTAAVATHRTESTSRANATPAGGQNDARADAMTQAEADALLLGDAQPRAVAGQQSRSGTDSQAPASGAARGAAELIHDVIDRVGLDPMTRRFAHQSVAELGVEGLQVSADNKHQIEQWLAGASAGATVGHHPSILQSQFGAATSGRDATQTVASTADRPSSGAGPAAAGQSFGTQHSGSAPPGAGGQHSVSAPPADRVQHPGSAPPADEVPRSPGGEPSPQHERFADAAPKRDTARARQRLADDAARLADDDAWQQLSVTEQLEQYAALQNHYRHARSAGTVPPRLEAQCQNLARDMEASVLTHLGNGRVQRGVMRHLDQRPDGGNRLLDAVTDAPLGVQGVQVRSALEQLMG